MRNKVANQIEARRLDPCCNGIPLNDTQVEEYDKTQNCLDPCCNGIPLNDLQQRAVPGQDLGLDPCCNGIPLNGVIW